MKSPWGLAVVAVACLGAASCHLPSFGGKAKAPEGQVAATVDGQEVTVRELQAELAGVTVTDPAQKKQIEQAALQRILQRKILAKAARDQGIDKTPDFALVKDRAMDTLLAQALETKIAAAVPPPTREEAQSFVTSHPDMFAERKIFVVDQIRMARPSDAAVIDALKPLKTMDAIVALLTADHIQFQRGTPGLDALNADPRLVAEILKMPAGEVFVIPNGNLILINVVKETRVVPVTGEPAITFAMNLLKRQHAQEAVAKQLQPIVTKAAASVRYNALYQPPAAAKAAPKPAAPAAGGGAGQGG